MLNQDLYQGEGVLNLQFAIIRMEIPCSKMTQEAAEERGNSYSQQAFLFEAVCTNDDSNDLDR